LGCEGTGGRDNCTRHICIVCPKFYEPVDDGGLDQGPEENAIRKRLHENGEDTGYNHESVRKEAHCFKRHRYDCFVEYILLYVL
jgi:hypothetical protein